MQTILFPDPVAAMQQRYSCRSYDTTAIPQEKVATLQHYMEALRTDDIRLAVVSLDHAEKIGTYGIIKNARQFVVCIVNSTLYQNTPEVCGFQFEQFILAATTLGINTCWLGGTFTRERFEKSLGLQSHEIIPYITPVGFAADKKTWLDKTMRRFAKSDTRMNAAQLFFQDELQQPLNLQSVGLYAQALEMVRIAPSASNKQPWRIVKTAGAFHFYLLRSKGYAKLSSVDLQRSDIGIALCHFALTCESLQLPAVFAVKADAPRFEEMEYIGSYMI